MRGGPGAQTPGNGGMKKHNPVTVELRNLQSLPQRRRPCPCLIEVGASRVGVGAPGEGPHPNPRRGWGDRFRLPRSTGYLELRINKIKEKL